MGAGCSDVNEGDLNTNKNSNSSHKKSHHHTENNNNNQKLPHQTKPNPGDDFKNMDEWEGERYSGVGIKRLVGYKCDLPIDLLNSKREEYWSNFIIKFL